MDEIKRMKLAIDSEIKNEAALLVEFMTDQLNAIERHVERQTLEIERLRDKLAEHRINPDD
jgi:hypothetical protein